MKRPDASFPADMPIVDVTTYHEYTSARVEVVVNSDMIDLQATVSPECIQVVDFSLFDASEGSEVATSNTQYPDDGSRE